MIANFLIPRLDIDLGARNWKLESTFLNSVVFLHIRVCLCHGHYREREATARLG
jgi:hypothetical protein